MADWSTAFQNNLPDSSFAFIEPGGEKDSEGKTTPRSLRHLPYKDASGKVDPAHCRNALARLDQTQGIPAEKKASIKSTLQSALSRVDQTDNHLFQVALENAYSETIELDGGVKQYKKQLVKFGKWVDPLNPKVKMSLDKKWAQTVVDNFKKKVVGRVPVPLSHTDLPEYNSGELLDLSIQDDGLYGTLDIRDPKTAQAIENDLIWDVSISFDNQYQDKKSGTEVGPTLLHVALVNNPYLKGMQPFQALANRMHAVMLSESKENDMALLQVKNDKEFDVVVKYTEDGTEKEVTLAPGQEIEVPEDVAEEVKGQVEAAVAPEPEDKPEDKPDDEDKPEDKPTEGESDLEKENAQLKDQLAKRDAEDSYTKLLSEGRIVPAQKDAYIALATARTSTTISLADGSTKSLSELLTNLLSTGPKRLKFSEDGLNDGEEVKTPWDELSDEERAANDVLGVTKDQFNEVNSVSTK